MKYKYFLEKKKRSKAEAALLDNLIKELTALFPLVFKEINSLKKSSYDINRRINKIETRQRQKSLK
jgi:hypothetical protein